MLREGGAVSPPGREAEEVFSGALNMEVQRRLRKGQYTSSSIPSVFVSLSLSLTLIEVSTLSRNKDNTLILL